MSDSSSAALFCEKFLNRADWYSPVSSLDNVQHALNISALFLSCQNFGFMAPSFVFLAIFRHFDFWLRMGALDGGVPGLFAFSFSSVFLNNGFGGYTNSL